jgi:hypothetical protein
MQEVTNETLERSFSSSVFVVGVRPDYAGGSGEISRDSRVAMKCLAADY